MEVSLAGRPSRYNWASDGSAVNHDGKLDANWDSMAAIAVGLNRADVTDAGTPVASSAAIDEGRLSCADREAI